MDDLKNLTEKECKKIIDVGRCSENMFCNLSQILVHISLRMVYGSQFLVIFLQ